MTDKILIERSVVEQVMNWLSIINEPSAVKHVMRLEEILGAALEQPPRQPLTDEQIVPLFSKRQKQQTKGEKNAWYFYAWGVNDGEAAHGIKE